MLFTCYNSVHFQGKFSKKPFVKFICHSASYIFFLLLLALASQRAEMVVIDLIGKEWQSSQTDDAWLDLNTDCLFKSIRAVKTSVASIFLPWKFANSIEHSGLQTNVA